MGIEDLANNAKDFLKSDKAEEISDNILGKAAEAANKVTGGKFEEQVEGVRKNIDGAVGNE